MKKRLLSMTLAMAMTVGLLAGCGGGGDGSGSGKSASWKVTCPWAPSGVAAMVSQKAAAKSTQYSDNITLVAEAIAGDAATVNTWVMDTEANDPELVFVGEGLLSITSTIDLSCPDGEHIPIEERDGEELRSKFYAQPQAPAGVKCYNPAFDVTPHELISAIITEKGVYYKNI